MSYIPARWKTPDPSFFRTCGACDHVFSRKAHLKRHRERKNSCIDDIPKDTSLKTNLSSAELAASKKAERSRINRQNYLRHKVERQKKAYEYSRRFRGRQGSLTKGEMEMKFMRMLWRRMLRSVYWEEMDEEDISSRAEDITSALRKAQNDPQKIINLDLKDTILETYDEMNQIFAGYPHIWDSKRRMWAPMHFKLEESDGDPDPVLEGIYRPAEDESDSEGWDE
ncbi:hypothetical protein CPB86DRAFT_770484 [Serendipita vermifera]|nr:hypothetical protein CPB86DRAFT_770484 [Serendipita vermifera]